MSLAQGYEEVHVPALKPKPFAEGEALLEIGELKEWMRPAFAGMKSLNRVQSRVANTALYTGENILLCAPTGAGKTNVAMLTILHEVGMRLPAPMRSPCSARCCCCCAVWCLLSKACAACQPCLARRANVSELPAAGQSLRNESLAGHGQVLLLAWLA